MSKSLMDIVNDLEAMDRGEFDDNPEQMRIIGEELRQKIDSYRFRMDQLNKGAELHKEYAQEHAEKAKSLTNQADRMKQLLKFVMGRLGFDMLAGTEFKVKMSSRDDIKVKHLVEPTKEQFSTYRDYLKLSWDKAGIKRLAKTGDKKAQELCQPCKIESIRWSAK